MSNIRFLLMIFFLIFCFGFFSTVDANRQAEDRAEKSSNIKREGQESGIKKKHSFEDLVIQGKFRRQIDGVITVESEKEFGRLIQLREDFVDRMEFLE